MAGDVYGTFFISQTSDILTTFYPSRIGWKWALPLVPYGETFKRHRKYLQQYFSKPRLPKYYSIQKEEAHRLLNNILEDPENYRSHIQRY
jgi:hypothetical protein